MPTRIAVIDDETVFLDLLRELLSEEGYEPHLFSDGAASYQRVRDLAPDAIILDLRMESPTAGWQLLERMWQDPVLHATPVILCSGDLPLLRERAAALQAHGCAHLAKPFDLGDLLALLEHVCGGPARASD